MHCKEFDDMTVAQSVLDGKHVLSEALEIIDTGQTAMQYFFES